MKIWCVEMLFDPRDISIPMLPIHIYQVSQ
jgi:hypothetical protein